MLIRCSKTTRHGVSLRSARLRLSSRIAVGVHAAGVRFSGIDIGVEHVSEYIFGVLETFDHLEVGGLHGTAEGVGLSLAALVDVLNELGLAAQHDLCVVLEVHLHHLVREAEHHCVPGAHPLLHIHHVLHLALRELVRVHWGRLVGLGLFTTFKVASEMLEKGDFLLQLLGVFSEGIFFADVLSVGTSSLVIVKMIAVRIEYDLGGVVKIDTGRLIG